MVEENCIFCRAHRKETLARNEHGYVQWDTYPVNKGHILIVPYRHIPEYFDASDEEKAALWCLVDEAKSIVDREHSPDGYNVGINVGKWAGQSIFHLHIHLIPRYRGDVENPQGGVRAVIPHRQKYTRKVS